MIKTNLVDNNNEVFEAIMYAKTYEDMFAVKAELKDFVTEYRENDITACDRLIRKYENKLDTMVAKAENAYNAALEALEGIQKETYTDKSNDEVAVNNKTLELMAKLPTEKTEENKHLIDSVLSSSIQSGIVGSKAVLNLLKYPVYSGLIDTRTKNKAYESSRSTGEKLFITLKSKALEEQNQKTATAYSEGAKLRRLKKSFDGIYGKSVL